MGRGLPLHGAAAGDGRTDGSRRTPGSPGHIAFALTLAAASAFPIEMASASEVSGVTLVLTRAPAAEDCADEAALATEVRERLGTAGDRGHKPAVVEVRVTREAYDYGATIRVEGENAGVRVLRAVGPTCKPLYDALLVALLVLLDANAQAESQPAPPLAPALAPALAGPPPLPFARPSTPEIWFAAGSAATHGLPLGLGVALLGDLQVRIHRWTLGAGAYWAPERSVALSPGDVRVRAWGGDMQVCYTVTPRPSWIRASACALGVLSMLHGSGNGFDTTEAQDRPWAMGGAGADLEFRVASRVAFGVRAAALLTVHREAFSVDPLGTAFETDLFVARLGADLRVRIW